MPSITRGSGEGEWLMLAGGSRRRIVEMEVVCDDLKKRKIVLQPRERDVGVLPSHEERNEIRECGMRVASE